jgi:hypothetical protein
MARGIPDQVAENRRDVTRLDGQFVSVPDRVQQNLRFERNTIAVEVTVEVYTRSLGSSLISGHPNGSQHGSGHGVAGDVREDWSLVNTTTDSAEWTREGRNAVRDALDGQPTGAIGGTAVGTGSGTVQPSDSTLTARTGDAFAYGVKDAANEVRARSQYLYAEAGDGSPDPQEFGLESGDGSLMARATLSSAVTLGRSEELRVDLTATITGSTGTNKTVTSDGEAAIADSIQTQGSTVGLAELAWGTGTPTIDPSTSALASEVFRKDAARSLDLETIEVSAPQFEFEPSGQPYDYTEAAVVDNQGRVVWLVDFTSDPYPKDEQTQFATSVGFRIV